MVYFLIFVLIIVLSANDDNHCDICGRCNGTGKIMDVTVGMGQHGFLPSVVEIPCPKCGGIGRID